MVSRRKMASEGQEVGNRRSSASRVESGKSATGRGNVGNWASHAKLATRKKLQKIRLAGWNARGLNQQGKLQILQEELKRTKINVAAIPETHWHASGYFRSSVYTVYFSGTKDRNIHGAGILVSNRLSPYVLEYEPINERICSLKINAKPRILNILSLYGPPTSATKDHEIEEFYRAVKAAINKIPNKGILILLVDFNAKNGSTVWARRSQ